MSAFPRIRRGALLRALTVLGSGLIGSCSTCSTGPTDSEAFSIAVSEPVGEITRGGSGPITVTLTRLGGFSDEVRLTGKGNYNVITVAPVTVPTGHNTQTVTMMITVPLTMPYTGDAFIEITASATGQTDATGGAPFRIVSEILGSYTFNLEIAPLLMTAGSSTQDLVNIVRSNFTGGISVTGTSDLGITITGNLVPTTTNQTTITVAVDPSVSTGTHFVILKGTAPGLLDYAHSFAVEVSPQLSPTLVVSPHSVSLSSGRQTTLVGVVANGLNVTDVTWASRNPAVATIAANGSRAVTVTGVQAGSQTYVIGSYAYFGGTALDSTLVTVTAASSVAVATIMLEPPAPTVANGGQVQFRVRYFAAGGNEINAEVGSTTTFSNFVSAVAQIGSGTGLLTAKAPGQTTVQAAYRASYYPVGQASLLATSTVTVP